ncbi:MAG: hypothetical protein AB7L92_03955 [Alphaproteobacteria bacterium]
MKGQPPEPDKKQRLEKDAATAPEKSAAIGAEIGSGHGSTPGDKVQHPGVHMPQELTAEKWEKDKLPWNATPQGRLAIRMFSRGVMGAAFFTAGGMLTRKWMHTPDNKGLGYEHGYSDGKYDAAKPLFEQDNPLKFIAKLIDTVAGKPIEFTVRTITQSEELGARAVRFRPTKYKDAMHSAYMKKLATYDAAVASGKTGLQLPPMPQYYRGRSLGNEAVSITFDFFSASIGDALGRDIAGWFDPNVKKAWIKDGHLDVSEAVKSMNKSAWRYVSYNGGEDWAVAIPYAYFMKGQRSVINKFSPGWRHDFDRGLNGASFKTIPSKTGNPEHPYSIVGNFNMEGALDFQNRFVMYNVGTLAYREAYDYVGRRLHGEHAKLYGAPDAPTRPTLAGKAADVGKWLARSFVKGVVYMTPAVPFFWITRVPQTNNRGMFINPETGETLSYKAPGLSPKGHEHYRNVYANDLTTGGGMYPRQTPVYWANFEGDPNKRFNEQYVFEKGKWLNGRIHNPPAHDHPFNSYAGHHFSSAGQKIFNKIGEANYKLTRMPDGVMKRTGEWLAEKPKLNKGIRSVIGLREKESLTRFSHAFINSSVSYTPYMYVKAEAANLWDDGKMDMATERMIDGAAGLNWGEFKAGVGEVWRSILHKPLADLKREVMAQHRIEMDTSPPAAVSYGEEQEQLKRDRRQSNWRERVVQAHPDDRPEVGRNDPKSHAEREEMRKALENMHPPTNSIN